MRICLICVEIFAWGKYGGYGRSTRMIGRELARRGIEVTAVVPRRARQRAVEMLDGIRVLGFDPGRPFSAVELFRQADADIYHSQEPSFGTYLAQLAMPKRKHLITFRDTHNLSDWWIEFMYPSRSKSQVFSNFLYEDNFLVHQAVREADRWLATAKMLIPKARKKYRLSADPLFMPSPVPLAESIQKSERPVVCFVARLDRRKRPQIFLELADQFPEVQFEVAGMGQDQLLDQNLRNKYGHTPNLKFHGFVDQFNGNALTDLLSRSWILINTSARESLPTTFIEAAGHGCAILSEADPDGFASNFGYHVKDGNYSSGLQTLLSAGQWNKQGRLGYDYVRSTYTVERAMQLHTTMYEEVMAG
ncbi:MAG TPA: glycosyltransferase family 4 protein [Anaerolineales bacterium]|nr:glycosyltransferase family 4 protein [Anaerolineales bacterium]